MKGSHNLKIALLAAIFALTALAGALPALAGPDLDVSYISRTPKYDRYNVTYTSNINPADPGTTRPSLSPTEQAKKRWPSAGELVTFTALIRNSGNAHTGTFAYKWYFDGEEVASGTMNSIPPGGYATTSWIWNWDSEQISHRIKFVADPDNLIAEDIETNNSREDYTNALCFSIYVWQDLYDWFKTEARKTNPNIASFDDWVQQQIFWMNKMFQQAVYPSSPNGILERVRIDRIVIYPESTPDPEPWATHAPEDIWADGRRGFTTTEYLPIFLEDLSVLNTYMPSCIHEWGHQLGMIDIYQLNNEGENTVGPKVGWISTRAGDMMESCGDHYTDHTAYFMNSNLHSRRGFYGEYLYDVPATCRIRLLDAYHRPIPNATIKFHQSRDRRITSQAAFTGVTDAFGYFTLPNRNCYGSFTTATGHTLHNNPWGLINVVGVNGNFFCDITTADNQKDYQYIEILQFNVAYRAGYTDFFTYDLQSSIIADGRPTTDDLFGVKMVSPNLGYTVGSGGVILKYNGEIWAPMTSPTTRKLVAVDAAKDGLACAVGDNGTVLLLQNGVWTSKSLGTTANFKTCAIVSPTTIVVGGEGGALYRTTNGGSTWTKQSTTYNDIRGLSFFDHMIGIMATGGTTQYRTLNGGATWMASAGTPVGYYWLISGCSMTSPSEAWISTKFGDVYKSTDGGRTWNFDSGVGYTQGLTCIDMRPGGYGWTASLQNDIAGIAVSSCWRFDKYNRWKQPMLTYGDKGDYYGVSCVSANEAWAVGKGGLILHLMQANIDAAERVTPTTVSALPDGSSIMLTGMAASASFPESIYLESYPERISGIKVLTPQNAAPGTLVRVTGTLDTVGLERVIRYGDVVGIGAVNLKPLGMNLKAVTGSASDATLNTIPLLIKTAGQVSERNEAEGWFTLDDGSIRFDALGNRGIKVISTGIIPPVIGQNVTVTGISTFETVGGDTFPVIRTRGAEDIEP